MTAPRRGGRTRTPALVPRGSSDGQGYGPTTGLEKGVHPECALTRRNARTRTPAARKRGGVRVQGVRVVSPDIRAHRSSADASDAMQRARTKKGHKGTWQHVSCGPGLRPASALRSEDVLVGMADGFHRSLRSPDPSVAALTPAMPSAALEGGFPGPRPAVVHRRWRARGPVCRAGVGGRAVAAGGGGVHPVAAARRRAWCAARRLTVFATRDRGGVGNLPRPSCQPYG